MIPLYSITMAVPVSVPPPACSDADIYCSPCQYKQPRLAARHCLPPSCQAAWVQEDLTNEFHLDPEREAQEPSGDESLGSPKVSHGARGEWRWKKKMNSTCHAWAGPAFHNHRVGPKGTEVILRTMNAQIIQKKLPRDPWAESLKSKG